VPAADQDTPDNHKEKAMMDLQDKVALVTGAASGIGKAIATTLAEQGARVAVSDRDLDAALDVARELEERGLSAHGFELDVLDWEGVHAAVARAESDLGPLDVLVNNAGLSSVVPFFQLSEEEWDRVIDVNLKGAFITCKAVLPGMSERGRGRVVNLSSILGKLGEANFAHYAASKFGVIGLTQTLAHEMAPFDITVNSVCPGIVDTPMWDQLYVDAVEKLDAFTKKEDIQEFVRSRIPLGRTQTPQDIAEMVAFLASDRARNITGASFHVDGGLQPR
jgi:NAD(P)-dependent dehydrogenase (short-subunit alcohol dehydrogenase family)